MSVESRTPTGTLVLSAIEPLGRDGTPAAQPFLDVEGAIYDDAFRDRDERRSLWGRSVRQRRRVEASTWRQAARPLVEYQALFRRNVWLSAEMK